MVKLISSIFFCSVTQLCLTLCNPMDCSTTGFPYIISQSLLKLLSLSWQCHPTISSIVTHFSCPQSLPASESFPMITSLLQVAKVLEFQLKHQFFQWIFRVDFLGFTGLISLQSNGLSRVFSITTVQKHKFFSAQPSLWSNTHNHTWLWEKPYLYIDICWQSNVSAF